MKDKTKDILLAELKEAKKRIADLEQEKERQKDEAIIRRMLVEHSRDGIVVLDKDGKVYEANKRYADMLGYSREELLKMHVWEWEVQVSSDQVKEMIRTVDEKGDHFQSRHRRKDGSTYEVEISTDAIFYRDQKLIFCVCRDISERKKMEENLRQSEAKFSKAFQLSPNLMAITTLDKGKIIDVNNTFCSFHGTQRENLIGKFTADLGLWADPASRDFILNRLKENKKVYNIETVMRRINTGEERTVLFSADIIILQNEELLLSEAVDITESKMAEIEKSRLEEELRHSQKLEGIGTLAGGVAHDFNNILGIILGNAELVLDDIDENDPEYYNLTEIKNAGLRAKDIIRQLLTFSRYVEVKKYSINLNPILEESIKFLRSTIPSTIEIRYNLNADNDFIFADSTQIHQVMMNLCINAAQAMEQNGGLIKISLENFKVDEYTGRLHPDLKKGEYVKLTVQDTGPGIVPEIQDRIFDPYFTTKDSGKGSGMGLSLVHGIIKNHNGTIAVHSTPGKGAAFSILLPLAPRNNSISSRPAESIPKGKERILFVDDEISLAAVAQKMIEKLGYAVKIAVNPEDALNLFRKKPDDFDLVITDMTMPQITGEVLFYEIRKIRKDIPVILSTGYSTLMNEEKAMRIGLTGYIMKPFKLRQMAEIIRKAIDAVPPSA
ncbi:MAG: PAS domain S-box protein [Spirochaetes bacterium]|nr:PAS domain S-box protein [Spirochaetota bacterium]